jgi:hypothetical protein
MANTHYTVQVFTLSGNYSFYRAKDIEQNIFYIEHLNFSVSKPSLSTYRIRSHSLRVSHSNGFPSFF